jgi:hypothetical protein
MPNGESESGSRNTAGGELQRRAATELQALLGRVVERGVGPLQGSIAYAEDRLRRSRRNGRSDAQAREAAIRRIVREAVAEAGTTGLVTGLGGFVTMPVTIPSSLFGNFLSVPPRYLENFARICMEAATDNTRRRSSSPAAGSQRRSRTGAAGSSPGGFQVWPFAAAAMDRVRGSRVRRAGRLAGQAGAPRPSDASSRSHRSNHARVRRSRSSW